MPTRMTSKTIAKTERSDRIRVRLAPKIVSARKKGAERTINPAKDLHARTHDQSLASGLQLFPRNLTTQRPRRTETAIRFVAPRTCRHLGRPLLSLKFKKRTHAIPSNMGGENRQKELRVLNSHKPRISREYAGNLLDAKILIGPRTCR